MIDFDKAAQLIADGFISRQKHPTADLWILNYTQKAQFDWHWTRKLAEGLLLTPRIGSFSDRSRSFSALNNLSRSTCMTSWTVR